MLSATKSFIEQNQNACFVPQPLARADANYIVWKSRWPWLKLDLQFDWQTMLDEARALRERFVTHRSTDEHSGWRSLCLHGISENHTEHYANYGYTRDEDVPYVWTQAAQDSPATMEFLKNVLPVECRHRVRFMLLEAGGHVGPHQDRKDKYLNPVNIALNNPVGCDFWMEHQGRVPFTDGSAFLMDVSNRHVVWNNSPDDRYHIIVHGHHGDKVQEFNSLVERSYRNSL